MNQVGENHYSTLEVDDSRLPEAHPLGSVFDLPEVSVEHEKSASEKPFAEKPAKAPTILGLHRRTFWIVLAVVTVIILAAAIGGGVGGSKASKPSAGVTTPTSTSAPASSTSSPSSTTTTLVDNSKLASVNYTDSNNIDHYRVFYQVTTNAIYQSAWNSSAKSWVVLPVTTKEMVSNAANDLDVRPQTPISSTIYWHSVTEIDFHVYYLDSKNTLNELFINGPGSPDGPWSISGLNGQYEVPESSQLASYGRACSYCFDASIILYEGANNNLLLVQLTDNQFVQSGISTQLPTLVDGSAIALMPTLDHGSVGVALYTNGVNLNEILYNGTMWTWSQKFSEIISPTASIAAFSYGIDPSTNSYVNQQVFSTNGGASSGGGVSLLAYREGNGWSGAQSNLSVLSSVTNYSAIATNHAGRVYGIVSGAGGAASPKLTEWAFEPLSSTYKMVGTVDTP